jgi:hypothetical protein
VKIDPESWKFLPQNARGSVHAATRSRNGSPIGFGKAPVGFSRKQTIFFKGKWSHIGCCWDPLRAEKGRQVQKYRIRDDRQIVAPKGSKNDATIVVK